tara:strand:+ start:5519 stop:5713 length:195 start_codon:yes stop_codon:yes gene_type:complete
LNNKLGAEQQFFSYYLQPLVKLSVRGLNIARDGVSAAWVVGSKAHALSPSGDNNTKHMLLWRST